MTINCTQLKEIVIVPACSAIGLFSESATNILLGTCAQETQLGKYLVQTNTDNYKGGIGIYQMQKGTYDYIWGKMIDSSAAMRAKVKLYLGFEGKPYAARMSSDLSLATIMARLFYANVMEKLPDPRDIEGLAAYWKKYYNSEKGKGTVEQFIMNYRQYVL